MPVKGLISSRVDLKVTTLAGTESDVMSGGLDDLRAHPCQHIVNGLIPALPDSEGT